jgi:hypothetical protein
MNFVQKFRIFLRQRIIGERIVPTSKKILSFYDRDARVIVRGKAGNESQQNDSFLQDRKTYNAACPRNVKQLQKNYLNQSFYCYKPGVVKQKHASEFSKMFSWENHYAAKLQRIKKPQSLGAY